MFDVGIHIKIRDYATHGPKMVEHGALRRVAPRAAAQGMSSAVMPRTFRPPCQRAISAFWHGRFLLK